MERLTKYLREDVDFNIEIYNQIQELKDKRLSHKIDPNFVVFACNLKLDIIQMNDLDLSLSHFVQSNYPYLDEFVREYVESVLQKEPSLKNQTIQKEQILPTIEILNGNLSSSLNIYSQKNILQKALKEQNTIIGELVLIDQFQVLKIYPIENYFSLRRYSYKCGCYNESKLVNKNLMTHILESSSGERLPACHECKSEMIEQRDASTVELCQKILVYIPHTQSNNTNIYNNQNNNQLNIDNNNLDNQDADKKQNDNKMRKGGRLYEMYIQKQYCNKLKVNQTYSCIAYFSLTPTYKTTNKTHFFSGFKELEVKEQLFADTISTVLKAKNRHFNDQIISQTSFYAQRIIEQSNSDQDDDEETNIHLRFKQMMFAVDSFFDQKDYPKFCFLHLKSALVLSYVLTNSQSILNSCVQNNNINNNPQSQIKCSEQLNVLFQSEQFFMESALQLVINSFQDLEDLYVFDCLLQTDLTAVLIQSNNGIIIIRNMQDISKSHSEILEKVLQNQEIYVDSLKTKINLKCTVWAFFTLSESEVKSKRFQNSSQNTVSSISQLEQLFDVCLSHEKSKLSVKDYQNSLSRESENYLKQELQNNNLIKFKSAHELSTAKKKKSNLSKINPFKEEQASTFKKSKGNISKLDMNPVQNMQQQNIGQNKYYKEVNTMKQSVALNREQSGVQNVMNIMQNGQNITQKVQQSEEQAYELLDGFVNTIRNAQKNETQLKYSTKNIESLSKFTYASCLLRNVFIKQSNPQEFITLHDNSEQQQQYPTNCRILIDIFDAFLAVFFNILSRKIFSNEVDTKYFLSFILNYGVGYQENSEMVNSILSDNIIVILHFLLNSLSRKKRSSIKHWRIFKTRLLNLLIFDIQITGIESKQFYFL